MSIKNIGSEEALKSIMKNNDAIIIDVRTEPEWQRVGKPKLQPNLPNRVLLISWRVLPEMSLNLKFLASIEQEVNDKTSAIYFICRSGARSFEAARFVTAHGFTNCFNIADGFEGNHFGLGWKSNNLPWEFLENVS